MLEQQDIKDYSNWTNKIKFVTAYRIRAYSGQGATNNPHRILAKGGGKQVCTSGDSVGGGNSTDINSMFATFIVFPGGSVQANYYYSITVYG